MDIAYYISDLLGQQGEVTVPNLGYFVQIRMPAYYDSQLKKFFPPHFSVQFDPQVIDEDESLANHISAIKKISASSAKYFIEKYTGNLKSQAVVEDVNLDNLGTFSSDGIKLTFQSATKSNDPSFFAYPPINVYKIGEEKVKAPEVTQPLVKQAETPQRAAAASLQPAASTAEKKPFTLFNPQPVKPAVTAPVDTVPLNAADDEDEIYETEPKRLGIWIIVLIAFTLLIVALGALYKFKPELFKFLKHQEAPVAVKPAPLVIKKDSVADSLAKKAAAIRDSLQADSAAKAAAATTAAGSAQSQSVKTNQPEVITPNPADKPAEAKKQDVTVNKPAEKPVTAKKPDVVIASPPKSAPPVNIPVATSPSGNISEGDLVKGSWVIRAGTFPIRSLANKRLEELKIKGYAQAHFEKENVKAGNNYKVIMGVYKTKAEAADAKKELTASGKLKDGELLIEQL